MAQARAGGSQRASSARHQVEAGARWWKWEAFPAAARAPWSIKNPWASIAFSVPVLAALLALSLALAFLVPLLRAGPGIGGPFGSRGPEVPEVVGMSVEQARDVARDRGLTLSVVGERETDRTRKDLIVQQAPIAGPIIMPQAPAVLIHAIMRGRSCASTSVAA